MSMNKADILYDQIIEYLMGREGYGMVRCRNLLAELHTLADPQAEELRTMRKRVEELEALEGGGVQPTPLEPVEKTGSGSAT